MKRATWARNPICVNLVGRLSLIWVPFDFMQWCTVERNPIVLSNVETPLLFYFYTKAWTNSQQRETLNVYTTSKSFSCASYYFKKDKIIHTGEKWVCEQCDKAFPVAVLFSPMQWLTVERSPETTKTFLRAALLPSPVDIRLQTYLCFNVCWPPVPSPSNWGCIIVLRLLNSCTERVPVYPALHPIDMDYGSIQPLILWGILVNFL
jgi:transposase-like protein